MKLWIINMESTWQTCRSNTPENESSEHNYNVRVAPREMQGADPSVAYGNIHGDVMSRTAADWGLRTGMR